MQAQEFSGSLLNYMCLSFNASSYMWSYGDEDIKTYVDNKGHHCFDWFETCYFDMSFNQKNDDISSFLFSHDLKQKVEITSRMGDSLRESYRGCIENGDYEPKEMIWQEHEIEIHSRYSSLSDLIVRDVCVFFDRGWTSEKGIDITSYLGKKTLKRLKSINHKDATILKEPLSGNMKNYWKFQTLPEWS